MAEIVCVTSEVPGALYPGVELARRLDAAGHDLTFAGPSVARRIVETNGIEFLPLEASGYDDFLTQDARRNALGRLFRLDARRARAVESLATKSLVDQVRRLNPALVLIDGELHEQIIALSATGAPTALLNSFVSIWRTSSSPPPSYMAQPGVGWRGSEWGTRLLWQRLRLWKWRRSISLWLRHVGCDRVSVLRRLARERGLDFRAETDSSHWLMPFTYRTLPVLSMHALEFEFPHRPPERVRYVGPLVLENRGSDGLDDASRERLEALFERQAESDRRLLYAGFGSFFSADLELVARLIRAVADHGRWDLVISLGGWSDPAELGELPESVHAFRWLPQLEVLGHADAAIVHGGINTVDECVLCGVPMLVYCGFETDMAGIASRISYYGLGIVGDGRRDGAEVIRGRIEMLLGEPRYRERVESFRTRYAAYAQDRVAERAVESVLARVREDRSG